MLAVLLEKMEYRGRMIAKNNSGSLWEKWWMQTDFRTMEELTGLRQLDYDPEDGYQAFVDACEAWWNSHSENEKITIWKENQ